MSPSARAAGRSWTFSASTAASAPSRCRPGSFAALDEWAAAAGITSGPVLRPVSKGGLVGDGPVSSQAVFETVIRHARLAGLGKVTPHDLRRTFAKLAHQGRAPLEQIQISAWGMPPSRLQSGIWASSRTCTMRLVIGWGSWAGKNGRRDKGAGESRVGCRQFSSRLAVN